MTPLRSACLAAASLSLGVLMVSGSRAVHAQDEIEAPAVTVEAQRLKLVESAPMRVELKISVEARGMTVGEGEDVFEHDGERYRVVSQARTAGVIRLFKRIEERRESRGEVTGEGIRPTYFHQERTGKRPKTATFDWNARRLTLTEGDDSETVAMPASVLDQTSLPYAFVFVEPPTSGVFDVQVTDGRRLTRYRVAYVGEERIRTPLGELSTLHYRKVQDKDDRRGFEFWLSTEHYRLPVRIRIVEKDGTAFDSTVTELRFDKR